MQEKNSLYINYRILLLDVVLLAIFLVWAELAVGIFGKPFAGSYSVGAIESTAGLLHELVSFFNSFR